MKFHSPRTKFVSAFVPIVALLTACGSDDLGASKLEGLEVGNSRQAVLEAIGRGPIVPRAPGDSVRIVNGFLHQQFLSGGKMTEVIWYREAPGDVDSPLDRTVSTPILLESDTLTAKGWAAFDKRAAILNIPNPSRNQQRIDSISRSQLPESQGQ